MSRPVNDGWREVVLTCPQCRLAVVTDVDSLMSGESLVCPRGHLLPGSDLSNSGLRQTVEAMARLIDQIEGHAPDPPRIKRAS